jgi:hypothetical protein
MCAGDPRKAGVFLTNRAQNETDPNSGMRCQKQTYHPSAMPIAASAVVVAPTTVLIIETTFGQPPYRNVPNSAKHAKAKPTIGAQQTKSAKTEKTV